MNAIAWLWHESAVLHLLLLIGTIQLGFRLLTHRRFILVYLFSRLEFGLFILRALHDQRLDLFLHSLRALRLSLSSGHMPRYLDWLVDGPAALGAERFHDVLLVSWLGLRGLHSILFQVKVETAELLFEIIVVIFTLAVAIGHIGVLVGVARLSLHWRSQINVHTVIFVLFVYLLHF